MTKEDIENAAIKNIEFQGKLDLGSIIENSCRESFVLGAEWRINSVWHDASEAPQHSGMLIDICKDGKAVLCGPNNSNWKTTVNIFRIVKWAYIEDLIPNMEDKA